MIYLMMVDGSYKQVPEAFDASIEGDRVVCYDRAGHIVASFASDAVTAYGSNEALKEPDEHLNS